jgi:hypothetical protein
MSLQDVNRALPHPYKIVNPAELDFMNVSTNTIFQLRKLQEDLEASRAENKTLNAKVELLKAEKARQTTLQATELEKSTHMMQALMKRLRIRRSSCQARRIGRRLEEAGSEVDEPSAEATGGIRRVGNGARVSRCTAYWRCSSSDCEFPGKLWVGMRYC